MRDWLGYSLSDFLLFSPETYWRLFELLNTAVWPFHLVLLGLGVFAIIAAARGWRHAGLLSGIGLAVYWALVAQLFFARHYQPINPAINWVLPVAWVQVLLLIVLAPGLRHAATGRAPWPAYGLLALALAYPVAGVLAGRPIIQSEVAGLAPDPTAVLTVGLVALACPDWRRGALSVLPVCWMIFSAATLLAMEEPTGWVLLGAFALAFWALWRRAED